MGKLVTPEVYLIGYSNIDMEGMTQYLKDSGNQDFLESIQVAREGGLSDGEILTSFYSKVCYASLTLGKNDNVTRIRDIPQNLIATLDQGHGSVWEHSTINFIVRNCSRVYTHEQVRHRVGTAYSQTSGRYVRGETIDIVFDPILEPVREMIQNLQSIIEMRYNDMVIAMGLKEMTNFDKKKKITSALRRLLPNGQANEIGISLNLRSIRHIIQIRTAGAAEWEIRIIYEKIYNLLKKKFPLLFYGAKEEMIEGIVQVSGMKTQPYEK